MKTPDAIAQRLVQAYRQRTPIQENPASGPGSIDAAYAAQRAVWLAMVGDSRPTVWKVGSPSREVAPTAAPVFPSRLATSPARYPGDLVMGLGIEAEIALRFGRDLPPRREPYSRAEIQDAIGSVHVAMELVATRLADPEAAGPLWRLADNLLNGALVWGDAVPHWRDLDWDGLTVQVLADGQPLSVVIALPPLGDLFQCLPWWLAHVGGAWAGDTVTTGAWSGMHPVGLATKVAVAFAGLGKAEAWIGERQSPE
jgi:2-keto-4-pentenoate hydratase